MVRSRPRPARPPRQGAATFAATLLMLGVSGCAEFTPLPPVAPVAATARTIGVRAGARVRFEYPRAQRLALRVRATERSANAADIAEADVVDDVWLVEGELLQATADTVWLRPTVVSHGRSTATDFLVSGPFVPVAALARADAQRVITPTPGAAAGRGLLVALVVVGGVAVSIATGPFLK